MKRMLTVCVCALGLGACSNVTGLYIVDAASTEGDTTVAAQKGQESPQPIDLNSYCFPEDTETKLEEVTVLSGNQSKTVTVTKRRCIKPVKLAYKRAVLDPLPDERRQSRNRLILTVMRRSEQVCDFHKGAIMANAGAMNFTSGFLSSVLSTMSTAFNPIGTKTALSAGAAVSGAAGTGLQANIYQNILTPAIITEIQNKRVPMRKNILSRLNEGVADYSITEALFEIERYHNQCSFYVGLAELAKDRTVKAKTKDVIQKEIDLLKTQRKKLEPVEESDRTGSLQDQEKYNEYKIYSGRIQNLMRLQEGAPGENIVSKPVSTDAAEGGPITTGGLKPMDVEVATPEMTQ